MYAKLFSCITDSSIWMETPATKVVWITLLAKADHTGMAYLSRKGLAKAAGVTEDECDVALEILASPDPDSRSKEHGGRRIEWIPSIGGWQLLNYRKYRSVKDPEERRVYQKDWDQAHRAGPKRDGVQTNPTLPTTPTNPTDPTHQIRSDQIIEDGGEPAPPAPASKGKRFIPPTVDEVRAEIARRKLRVDPEAFVAFYESKGWTVGKSPMKSWRAALTTWEKRLPPRPPSLATDSDEAERRRYLAETGQLDLLKENA